MDVPHGIPHILALSILKVTLPKSCSGPLSPLLGPSLHTAKGMGGPEPPRPHKPPPPLSPLF